MSNIYADYLEEIGSSGDFQPFVYLAKGDTNIILLKSPVSASEDDLEKFGAICNVMMPTVNNFNGNFSKKQMILGIVVEAPEGNKYPEDWQTKVVGIVLPTSLAKSLLDLLAKEYVVPSEPNEEGVYLFSEENFVTLTKTVKGSKVSDTSYTAANIPGRISKKFVVPEDLQLPEESLVEIANNHTQWQESKSTDLTDDIFETDDDIPF